MFRDGNLGSLSWISFNVAAAQVGSSSSSFLSDWELNKAGLMTIPFVNTFGDDWGANPAEKTNKKKNQKKKTKTITHTHRLL